jgi:DNA-nicking Smr family endonuclease
MGTTQNPLGNILEITATTYPLALSIYTPMTKESDKEKNELELFREAVAGTRRLRHDKIGPHRHRHKPFPRQRRLDDQQVLAESLAPLPDSADIEAGDELLFSRNGVQNSVMRMLRRG